MDVEIPLVVKLEPFGEFRLEPVVRVLNYQRFNVVFKFYEGFTITDEVLSILNAPEIETFLRLECLQLLRLAVKDGLK